MIKKVKSIAIVLPRGTSFGPARATSIDLCVHDFVLNSRFYESTTIYCDVVEASFDGFDLCFDYGGFGGQFAKALRIADRIKSDGADLVVVHQHLPTAALLSMVLRQPVLLHAHNFQKIKTNPFSRAFQRIRYAGLAGMMFVSGKCRAHFHETWPDVKVPTFVVHNGLDLSSWLPAQQRRKQVLVACRAAPEKGVLEAIQALQMVLPRMPGWSALFMLSEPEKHPEYFEEIMNVARESYSAISVLLNQPHEAVKEATLVSEIALVLSKWEEPFGRTAIEAHAGGAALISSGTGGLREVSADAALVVDPNDIQGIADALIGLSSDEGLRQHLVAAAHARMSELFDIRKVTNDLDRVYENYIGGLPPQK